MRTLSFSQNKKYFKNSNKGFFIWIDELRDYLNDENMCNTIIEAIMEIRKVNGVWAGGVQNLDFSKIFPMQMPSLNTKKYHPKEWRSMYLKNQQSILSKEDL